jgi:hypothetical protein
VVETRQRAAHHRVMRRAMILAAGVAVAVLSVSGPGSASLTTTSNRYGSIKIGFKGWGRVVLGKGFLDRQYTPSCMETSCPAAPYTSRLRAVATAQPMQGWKFVHWRGACKSTKPKCTIRLKHVRPDVSGYRHARLTATFAAAVPGFTRSWPVPLGHTASTDTQDALRFRVNSVTPSASLTPAAPAGAEYFVANITATYVGGGSYNDFYNLADSRLQVIGSHDAPYNAGSNGCPGGGPAPQLDSFGTLYSGQSDTGNVCWTIAANDASSLELYFDGSGYKTWLALH